MTSKSKAKGNAYESELVRQAKSYDLQAVRAWGSDGRSLGQHEGVDLIIEGRLVQAKRRAKIADYIIPNDDVDIQVIRADRGKSFAILRYDDYLQLLQQLKGQTP